VSTPALVWWTVPDPAALDHPLLDSTERARCSAYRREVDAARHATGRVLLKRAVAAWCGTRPDEVRVVPESGGRPRVVLGTGTATPWVSITHAGGVVGVALAGQPCGLDVQDLAAIEPVIGSGLVYSALERDTLTRLPTAERRDVACSWWVAKEAVLKAVGCGVVEPMPGVDGRAARVRLDVAGRRLELVRLVVAAPEGHRAALAVQTAGPVDVRLRSLAGASSDLGGVDPAP
jgi:4'-phosphopantetheinyl transferase